MTQKIKVMMVDDEARFRETTATLLRKKGFETTIAGSGEEAISIIREHPQDVVVLDVKMEGMDGHEALKAIKQLSPQTQVIMLTGHGSHDSAVNSHELAAYDYLAKPCDIDLLTIKINEAHTLRKSGAAVVEKKVREIMTSVDSYSTISVSATVGEAIEKLMNSLTEMVASSRIREAGHRSLIVFDEKKAFVGILSIKDLLKWVRPLYLSAPQSTLAESVRFSPMFRSAWDGLFSVQMKALAGRKISELVLEPPAMIDENANLMEVADLLHKSQKTRLIVTSGGKVIGILREQDLFFEIVNIIKR